MPTITKEEAAAILGKTPRAVERYAADNRLSVTYAKGKTRDVPMYDRAEVEALAEELSHPRTAARPSVVSPVNHGQSLITTRDDNGDTALSQLAPLALIERFTLALESSHAPKVLLTLQEAAELTGLSVNHLRKGIHEGVLDGRRVGRGFKVRPSDARAYAEDVFREAKKGYDQNQNNL